MIVVPLIVGLVLRQRASGLEWYHAAMAPAWLVAYFFFNVASLWLKSPVKRRGRYRRPLLTYGGTTAALGLVMIALGGWPVLWWAPWFAVLVGWAVWEVTHHNERALSSGAATIAAASTMTLVIRFTTPQPIWQSWADPATRWDVLVSVGLFAYFFGTVFHVKSLIRERGNKKFWVLSIGYHAATTLLAVVAASLGQASWWWTPFFVVCTARSAVMPWLANERGVKLRPGTLGIVELVLSLFVIAIALWG